MGFVEARRPASRLRPGFIALFLAAAMTMVAYVNVSAQKLTEPDKNPTLVLESADNNENSYNNGEFMSILRGNVVFVYDDITIRSDRATWWRNEGRVYFEDSIRIRRGSQMLTCDRMQFIRQNNRLDAFGRFIYVDTAEQARMSGEKATYRIDTRFCTLDGDPLLVKYDTASAETLTIAGLRMFYDDSLKLATVADSVVITKGSLLARCGRALYHVDSGMAALRNEPRVTYDIHQVAGDSIDLKFGRKSLRSASVYGSAHGVYIDTSGARRDTSFTHVWGDSLFMSVADSGYLDSLWVSGKALSKNYAASRPDVVNQAGGKMMLISFMSGGDVDRVRIWGNACSTYFIEENDSRGVNEASGDSITVVFRRGKASFLKLAGSARGLFYPDDI